MALFTSVLTAGGNQFQTTSEHLNNIAKDFITPGIVGSIFNNVGAGSTGGFGIDAQGSPNNTVNVRAGVAYVSVTPTSQRSQIVRVEAQTDQTVTIAPNATGSTRFDWIYIKVDATKAANPAVDSTDVSTLYTSRSTSSATDNGAPPSFGMLLAIVTVANGFSTITNPNISGQRSQAGINSAADNAINPSALKNAADQIVDYVSSGGVVTLTSGTTIAISSPVYYINGKRYSATTGSYGLVINQDYYIDIDATLTPTLNHVANGAASPALPANTIRLAKVVTNGTTVSSIVQQGRDSLGNRIYNISPDAVNKNIASYATGAQYSATGATLPGTSVAATLAGTWTTPFLVLTRPSVVEVTYHAQTSYGATSYGSTWTVTLSPDNVTYSAPTTAQTAGAGLAGISAASTFNSITTASGELVGNAFGVGHVYLAAGTWYFRPEFTARISTGTINYITVLTAKVLGSL